MPRSGSTYSLPAGSIVADGVDDILASQHNGPLQDIANDLNAARPIAAGGTGATTAADALVNLGFTRTAAEINALSKSDDRVINGNMAIWQRGTSGTINGYTAADRWLNGYIGGTATQSQQAHPLGTTFGVNNPDVFLRQSVSGQSLATHYAATEQRIENVRTYAGQTVTVMGWAKRGSGTGNMAVEILQSFGTGGSPSARVEGLGAVQVSLTGSWAPFAVTIAVPTVSGKTTGSNFDDFLGLLFYSSAGSNFNARTGSLGIQTIGVDLWGIHIRVGTFTTADVDSYVAPMFQDQLNACRPFYEVGTVLLRSPAIGAVAAGAQFGAQKRTTPTIATFIGTNSSFNTGSVTVQSVSSTSLNIDGSATAAGGFCFVNWSASAEL